MIFKQKAVKGQIQVFDKFNETLELQIMRDGYTPEFLEQFKKGVDLYVEGKWAEARDELEEVEVVKGFVDYPTRTLLEVIEAENFEAPKDWQGYRVFEDD